ncbi:uncharacterized protein LOC128859550 [Anastrepha ludens]|uniref:uncharacterized protein LOC128859550 n=1 Tax=Anastrepha ludens TaxID=28586 RepID=UPI0023B069FD|nr:uncharacterized protein LOC128859550 [Anastrepha ludens]
MIEYEISYLQFVVTSALRLNEQIAEEEKLKGMSLLYVSSTILEQTNQSTLLLCLISTSFGYLITYVETSCIFKFGDGSAWIYFLSQKKLNALQFRDGDFRQT